MMTRAGGSFGPGAPSPGLRRGSRWYRCFGRGGRPAEQGSPVGWGPAGRARKVTLGLPAGGRPTVRGRLAGGTAPRPLGEIGPTPAATEHPRTVSRFPRSFTNDRIRKFAGTLNLSGEAGE